MTSHTPPDTGSADETSSRHSVAMRRVSIELYKQVSQQFDRTVNEIAALFKVSFDLLEEREQIVNMLDTTTNAGLFDTICEELSECGQKLQENHVCAPREIKTELVTFI